MFLLRSRPTLTLRSKSLNAIAPTLAPIRQARRDRHLRQSERLAELAMQLAETAHAQALRDAQPPPERPRAAPGTLPTWMPPSSRAAYDSTIASQLFQEFSRCARQAILLEARLDSGAFDAAHPAAGSGERLCAQAPAQRAASHASMPNDETRLHHERLEDENFLVDVGSPETFLHSLDENLAAAVAQARHAGLDLMIPSNVSPPPRIATPRPPPTTQPPHAPHAKPIGARPRASPAQR